MPGFGARRPIEKLGFLVVGAQKAGTTALNYYLKRHPQIALPEKKELHFFDDDQRFAAGTPDYQELHAKFRSAPRGAVAGENTPNYLYWPTALERIHAYNPTIKLIAILRNPIERAFSQWNMQRTRGIEPLDFLEAIKTEPERLAQLPPNERRKFAYVDRGRYAGQIARVFDLFPREQVLIINYARFRAEQRTVIDEIYAFLGVAPRSRFSPLEAHGIPYERKPTSGERARVREILEPDIVRLEQLLGWNCDDWR